MPHPVATRSSTGRSTCRSRGPTTPTAVPAPASPPTRSFGPSRSWTKPQLAGDMITRAVEAGAPAAWVAGDEVYGADPELRTTIRSHGLGYVLQIAANRHVPVKAGLLRVDAITKKLPKRAWQRRSAGAGSKGQRWYSWAWVQLQPEDPHDPEDPE